MMSPETAPLPGPRPKVTTRRYAAHGVCLEGQGELDLLAAPLFGEAMATAVATGHRHFVIDLHEATLLDCSCLGAILGGMGPLRADPDAALVLAGASGLVSRLLGLLEFERTCSMVSSVDVAIKLAMARDGIRVEGWRATNDRRPRDHFQPRILSGGSDELSS